MDKKTVINEFIRLGITPSVIKMYKAAKTPQDELKVLCTSFPEITKKMAMSGKILAAMFPMEVLHANHVYINHQEILPKITTGETGYFFGDACGTIGEKGMAIEDNDKNEIYVRPPQGYFFENSSGEAFGNAQCYGYNKSNLTLRDQSITVCYDQTTFESYENTNVRAHNRTKGVVRGQSSVLASGETFIIKGTDQSMTYLNGNSSGVFDANAWCVANGESTCVQIGERTNIELNDRTRCISLNGGNTECHDSSLVLSTDLEKIKGIDIQSRALLVNYEILYEAANKYIIGDKQIIDHTVVKLLNENSHNNISR